MLVRGLPSLLALAVLVAACGDERHRPPPPPSPDAGPGHDAAAPVDAAADDAGEPADASGGGRDTVRRDYGVDFEVCPPFQVPVWGDLSWQATIPEGASIHFTAQVAPEGESFSAGARATLGTTPPATSPLYVSDLLPEAHRNDPQLRLTAELRWPTADTRPSLDSLTLDWECLDRP